MLQIGKIPNRSGRLACMVSSCMYRSYNLNYSSVEESKLMWLLFNARMINYKARRNTVCICIKSYGYIAFSASLVVLMRVASPSLLVHKHTGNEDAFFLSSSCLPVSLFRTWGAGCPSDVEMFPPELWMSCSMDFLRKWRCTMALLKLQFSPYNM